MSPDIHQRPHHPSRPRRLDQQPKAIQAAERVPDGIVVIVIRLARRPIRILARPITTRPSIPSPPLPSQSMQTNSPRNQMRLVQRRVQHRQPRRIRHIRRRDPGQDIIVPRAPRGVGRRVDVPRRDFVVRESACLLRRDPRDADLGGDGRGGGGELEERAHAVGEVVACGAAGDGGRGIQPDGAGVGVSDEVLVGWEGFVFYL